MKNKRWINDDVKNYTTAGIIVVLFYVLLTHLNVLGGVISFIFSTLAPFFLGIVFAFILLPLRNSFEKLFAKQNIGSEHSRRVAASILCLIVLILALYAFIMIVVPSLASSIKTLVDNYDSYMEKAEQLLAYFKSLNPDIVEYLTEWMNKGSQAVIQWLTGADGGLAQILNYSINFAKGVANFFIAMIIMVYILIDSDRFKRQITQLMYSIFPRDKAERGMEVLYLIVNTFNNFIFGKFVDSLIIGIIAGIVLSIMGIPYAMLFAVIIGITNMIPVFGPFIGAIPCLFILVIINPIQALEFLVFIIVLQQIDGNILGPKILSGAIGLPTFWVMFAIIVGGATLGVLGMFVGVPIFSVIYTLVKEWSERTLKDKKIRLKDIT